MENRNYISIYSGIKITIKSVYSCQEWYTYNLKLEKNLMRTMYVTKADNLHQGTKHEYES